MSDGKRNTNGQFAAGVSGNPGGRAKALLEVQELARKYTAENINGLMAIARNPKLPAQARVAARQAVLDRAWGKPAQMVEANFTKSFVFELPTPFENEDKWLQQLNRPTTQ